MSNKAFGWLITSVICAVIGIWGFCKTLHCNDFDKIQVIQSVNGNITINREGGWYAMVYPKIWTYPKACSYYFSNKMTQSKEHDAPTVRYANTGKGDLNCQVVYRIDWASDDQLKAMHEIAHGDDTVLEQRVLSTLNNIAQMAASKMNSTDAIKKYDDFFETIRKQMIHNKELMDTMAIDVVDFVIAGEPDFDKMTTQLFEAQQKADLEKQTAEAEKIRFEAEKERTIAQYAKEAAENEGKAKAQLAKEQTDAERVKKLAEIAASQKVEVEKLEKEQMLIKASKELEVAEIAKQTEAKQLEIIKIKADQKVAEAQAKKQQIELSGAITEVQQAELEYGYKRELAKWENIGKGIAGATWPKIVNLGGKDGTGVGGNAFEMLLQTMTMKNLDASSVVPATQK